jgi:hypothetical protein
VEDNVGLALFFAGRQLQIDFAKRIAVQPPQIAE